MRFLLGLVFVLFMAQPAIGQLVYRGEQTLWKDTVWNEEVLIDGILTVAPGVKLEIQPGVVVRFTRIDSNNDNIGDNELFIQGIFVARGTQERPILFTSAEKQPRPGDWGALNMMASAEPNQMEHCLVEYGYRGFHAHFAQAHLADSLFRYNRRGAQFQESTITIDDCRFENNFNGLQFRDSTVNITDSTISGGYWGLRCVYSNLKMTGCRIENNLVNGANCRDSEIEIADCTVQKNRRGLYLQRTHGILTGDIIQYNSEHGIYLEEATGSVANCRIVANGRAGFRIINSSMEITRNDIAGNDEYALINDGNQALLIAGNWWGTTDAAEIASLIRDGRDRPGMGIVNVNNPLNAPLP